MFLYVSYFIQVLRGPTEKRGGGGEFIKEFRSSWKFFSKIMELRNLFIAISTGYSFKQQLLK